MSYVTPITFLQNESSSPIFALSTRADVTERKLFSIQGNSILSSVFIKSIAAGSTLLVEYFQTTSGTFQEDGEEEPLNAHRLFTDADAGVTNTILVTRIHNKPQIKITVTGTVEFGVYGSVRSETASDIDTALQLDGSTVELDTDKGIPTMVYDETDGKFYFLRSENGAIRITGEVYITATEVTDREYGSDTISHGSTSTLISYTPAAGTSSRLHNVLCTGDGTGDFTIKINGSVWGIVRNSWNDRSPILPLNGKLISESDTITIEVENTSPAGPGHSCTFEAFLYRGPE